jgi:hypothetical protein
MTANPMINSNRKTWNNNNNNKHFCVINDLEGEGIILMLLLEIYCELRRAKLYFENETESE